MTLLGAASVLVFLPPVVHAAPICQQLAAYEGSEDASLWRAGLAFQSSGLCPSKTQGGLILLVNLTGDETPRVKPMEIFNLSASFGFRPHGIHIDNITNRVYAISHSDLLQEESIFVFDIIVDGAARAPAFAFRHALVNNIGDASERPTERGWMLFQQEPSD